MTVEEPGWAMVMVPGLGDGALYVSLVVEGRYRERCARSVRLALGPVPCWVSFTYQDFILATCRYRERDTDATGAARLSAFAGQG